MTPTQSSIKIRRINDIASSLSDFSSASPDTSVPDLILELQQCASLFLTDAPHGVISNASFANLMRPEVYPSIEDEDEIFDLLVSNFLVSPAQFNAISSAKIARLSATTISHIGGDLFSALTAEQVYALTGA